MPVQINEIVIRANIVEQPASGATVSPAAGGGMDKDEIIKECTELILELLKAQTER